MNEFFKRNAVALVSAGIVFASSYAVNNFKLDDLQARQDRQGIAIQALQSDNTTFKVQIGQLQKDVEYIKSGVDDIKHILTR